MGFIPSPIFRDFADTYDIARVFLAIEPSISQALAYDPVRQCAPDSAKIISAEDAHLSFAFLNTQSPENLRKIFNPLAEYFETVKPFQLTFKGLGSFVNNHQKPRKQNSTYKKGMSTRDAGLKSHSVLYAAPNASAASRLQTMHRKCCYTLLGPNGFPFGRRDMNAHMSLIHLKDTKSLEDDLHSLTERFGDVSAPPSLVRTVALLCDAEMNSSALPHIDWADLKQDDPDLYAASRAGKYIRLGHFELQALENQ